MREVASSPASSCHPFSFALSIYTTFPKTSHIGLPLLHPPENPSTRHKPLLLVGQGGGREEAVDTEVPSLSARESNGEQTDGLNLHGRLSAFPISRMHTSNGIGNVDEGAGTGARLIINGADFGINQGRESRRASSRAGGKKAMGRERERSRSIDNGQINPARLNKRKPSSPLQTPFPLAAANSHNKPLEFPVAFACVIITIV